MQKKSQVLPRGLWRVMERCRGHATCRANTERCSQWWQTTEKCHSLIIFTPSPSITDPDTPSQDESQIAQIKVENCRQKTLRQSKHEGVAQVPAGKKLQQTARRERRFCTCESAPTARSCVTDRAHLFGMLGGDAFNFYRAGLQVIGSGGSIFGLELEIRSR